MVPQNRGKNSIPVPHGVTLNSVSSLMALALPMNPGDAVRTTESHTAGKASVFWLLLVPAALTQPCPALDPKACHLYHTRPLIRPQLPEVTAGCFYFHFTNSGDP